MLRCFSRLNDGIWVGLLNRLKENDIALKRAAVLSGVEEDKLTRRDQFDFLYKLLSILDDKAQSLMQFNAFIIAVIALFWQQISGAGAGGWSKGAAAWTVLASSLSILACLFVVGIFWRFVGIAVPDKLEASDTASANDRTARELGTLCKVLGLRESAYQFAWWASLVSLIALVVVLWGIIV